VRGCIPVVLAEALYDEIVRLLRIGTVGKVIALPIHARFNHRFPICMRAEVVVSHVTENVKDIPDVGRVRDAKRISL
jgi:hypothetical protein